MNTRDFRCISFSVPVFRMLIHVSKFAVVCLEFLEMQWERGGRSLGTKVKFDDLHKTLLVKCDGHVGEGGVELSFQPFTLALIGS